MNLNDLLTYFIPTAVFSFLIGLEVRAYMSKFHENEEKMFFGTTRTYAFLGIFGFILYICKEKRDGGGENVLVWCDM